MNKTLPNVATPTGLVHRVKGTRRGTNLPQPACGDKRSRFLLPTAAPVTCGKCLAGVK